MPFRPTAPSPRHSMASRPAPDRSRWRKQSLLYLAGGGVLLAEAGTGTGKTLAYLVPAILSRKRVLVSTGTKNLQEQIFFKDLPLLRDSLGVPFTATCMKGRGELPLSASLRVVSREPGAALVGRNAPRAGPRPVADGNRDGRSRRGRGSSRRIYRSGTRSRRRRRIASARNARVTATASSSRCVSAQLNPTSSSSIITCCAPMLRCGRATLAR